MYVWDCTCTGKLGIRTNKRPSVWTNEVSRSCNKIQNGRCSINIFGKFSYFISSVEIEILKYLGKIIKKGDIT